MEQEEIYPESAEKLNWGAALLTPIWGIKHKKYLIAILSIVPVIGLGVSIMALIYGGRWAWDSQDWKTEFYFKESVSKWNIISICIFLIILVIIFLLGLN